MRKMNNKCQVNLAKPLENFATLLLKFAQICSNLQETSSQMFDRPQIYLWIPAIMVLAKMWNFNSKWYRRQIESGTIISESLRALSNISNGAFFENS